VGLGVIVLIVLIGVVAAVGALRLPRPQCCVALGVVAIALALLFWPVECATAEASAGGPAATTSCTSAVGLGLPTTGGIWIVLGGVALVGAATVVLGRRPQS
jgi:LPXTG-motif cell wall-anchored protein